MLLCSLLSTSFHDDDGDGYVGGGGGDYDDRGRLSEQFYPSVVAALSRLPCSIVAAHCRGDEMMGVCAYCSRLRYRSCTDPTNRLIQFRSIAGYMTVMLCVNYTDRIWPEKPRADVHRIG